MNIEQGEAIHRFVIFSTDDGRKVKVVSKQTRDKKIAAELMIEDIENEKEPVAHKFLDSSAGAETFERAHFDQILNNLMKLENEHFKKLCQKKFLGLWNFIDVQELPAADLQ